jgi:hypothetical protein
MNDITFLSCVNYGLRLPSLRLPTGLTEDTQVDVSHLYIIDSNVNDIGRSILFVTRTIFFRTLDVVDVRQRGVVLRIFVDFVGLLFVFFITRNTEVGCDDVGFLISAVSAVINEFSLFRHFHVVEVVAFSAEVHSLRYSNIVYSLSILI